MANLKSLFSTFKLDGIVVKQLDQYLLSLNAKDEDRATDVNSPSQVGACIRARYYARIGVTSDGNSIDARTRRIFDNGTGMHERIQDYLKKQGMLLMDEIPVFNTAYNILGSSDGIIDNDRELVILELKSINSNGFSRLKTVREDHEMQGLVYVYCVEEQRKVIQELVKTDKYKSSKAKRRRLYASMYQHLQDGAKYTREEKIAFRIDMHLKLDELLSRVVVPITKAVFVYENKDTQEMKEFIVSAEEAKSKEIISEFLADYEYLNQCVENRVVPDRICSSKSDPNGRWCSYKVECFN